MSAPCPTETWPRWLPSTYLRDQRLHFTPRRRARGACGVETMWVKPGHETLDRPHCAACEVYARAHR